MSCHLVHLEVLVEVLVQLKDGGNVATPAA
jgi:hypothetical protein